MTESEKQPVYYVVFVSLKYKSFEEAKAKAPEQIAAHMARSRELRQQVLSHNRKSHKIEPTINDCCDSCSSHPSDLPIGYSGLFHGCNRRVNSDRSDSFD